MPRQEPIRRSRTGCLTCRRRRKKCDEGRPHCEACTRSGYICDGYPTPVHFPSRKSTASPPSTSPRSTRCESIVGLPSCQDYAFDLPFGDDISTTPIFDDDAFDLASTDACLAADFLHSFDHHDRPSTSQGDNIPRPLSFLIDGITTESERRCFSHFTAVTSQVLTLIHDDHSPLLAAILPLGLHDTMVQKAILCLGASHLSKLMTAQADHRLEQAKIHFLQAAEQEQLERLSSDHANINPLLSSMLLLCLYEISEGRGDMAWSIRLDTARNLIQKSLPSPPSTTNNIPVMDTILLDFFTYHDVLALATDPTRTPLALAPTPSLFVPTTTSPTHCMLDPTSGLLDLLTRVASLRQTPSPSTRIQNAITLWTDLSTFQPSPRTTHPCERLACHAYIAALFIWLYSLIYPSNIHDAKVRGAVFDGLDYLDRIQTSGVLSVVLFPTFVIAYASVTEEERGRCTEQFERLRVFSGLGNVALAQRVVRESWEAFDDGEEGVWTWDWLEFLERRGVSLPIT